MGNATNVLVLMSVFINVFSFQLRISVRT